MTSARTSVTPTGTDHVHVPIDVNFRMVSEPTVDETGVHAAACTTSVVEMVMMVTDEMDRRPAPSQRWNF
jgi:hypothetical protein